ncbi:MAG: hypothetical protein ABIG20_00025 [archaeon]
MAKSKTKNIEDVEDLLQNLNDIIKINFSPEIAEGQIREKLGELRSKEQTLRLTLEELEKAKNAYRDELLRTGKQEIELHSTIKQLEAHRSILKDQIGDHKDDMDALKAEREQLNDKVSQLGAALAELREKITALSK